MIIASISFDQVRSSERASIYKGLRAPTMSTLGYLHELTICGTLAVARPLDFIGLPMIICYLMGQCLVAGARKGGNIEVQPALMITNLLKEQARG